MARSVGTKFTLIVLQSIISVAGSVSDEATIALGTSADGAGSGQLKVDQVAVLGGLRACALEI
jgi:hypothetical protein